MNAIFRRLAFSSTRQDRSLRRQRRIGSATLLALGRRRRPLGLLPACTTHISCARRQLSQALRRTYDLASRQEFGRRARLDPPAPAEAHPLPLRRLGRTPPFLFPKITGTRPSEASTHPSALVHRQITLRPVLAQIPRQLVAPHPVSFTRRKHAPTFANCSVESRSFVRAVRSSASHQTPARARAYSSSSSSTPTSRTTRPRRLPTALQHLHLPFKLYP